MIFEDKETWKLVEYFDKNENIFVVGDIHGKYDKLIQNLKDNNITDNDYLIFNGDIINKSLDTVKVIEYVLTRPKTILLLGNHEASFIDLMDHIFHNKLNYEPRENITQYNLYVENTLAKWMNDVPLVKLKEYAELILEKSFLCAEIYIEDKKIGIVHAEVPDYDWNCILKNFNQTVYSFNQYNDIQNNKHKTILNIDYVVFGHTPIIKPLKFNNAIYIDTGSYSESNPFTFLNLNNL